MFGPRTWVTLDRHEIETAYRRNADGRNHEDRTLLPDARARSARGVSAFLGWPRFVLGRLALGWLGLAAAGAADRIVLLDDLPRDLANFEVSADGSRLYFSHGKDIFVFDAEGKLIDKYGAPTAVREFLPLPNGWFVACLSHANGQLALYRPDGTFAQTLVGRGDATKLRGDMTGWTSPCGAAVDAQHGRLFALDTTMAPRDDRNLPDPDWSRIAVFDLDGKYVGPDQRLQRLRRRREGRRSAADVVRGHRSRSAAPASVRDQPADSRAAGLQLRRHRPRRPPVPAGRSPCSRTAGSRSARAARCGCTIRR